MALPIFEWTAAHALESRRVGRAGQPVHQRADQRQPPHLVARDGRVSTAIKYLEKARSSCRCATHCNQPVFRLRRRGAVEVKIPGHVQPARRRLRGERRPRDLLSADRASSSKKIQSALSSRSASTLAIDTRDCIGCQVCVAHCDKGVLKMVDGKALIDLRKLNQCDLDGECVEVCPTDVVTLNILPAEPTVPPEAVKRESDKPRGELTIHSN